MNKNFAKILRFKNEIQSLFFVLIVMIILLLLFVKISWVFLVASVALGLLYVRLLQARQLGNSLQINEKQFPEIYREAKECAKILQIKKIPKIFITQDPVLNAFTMGFKSPYTIVLNSGIVENMSMDEIRIVIGHEMGHVRFGHCLLLSLMSPLGNNLAFVDLLFGFWSRKTEYTADRCGFICSKNNDDAAVRVMVKIAIGPKACEGINFETIYQQLQNVREKYIDKAGELLGSHPYILKRIWEINKFSYQYNIRPCAKCGNINLREAVFCWSCGNKT